VIKVKFIIHGGSSFLGKHFVDLLDEKKEKVIVISRNSSKIKFESKNIYFFRYSSSINEIKLEDFDLTESVFYEFAWFGVYGNERNDTQQFSVNVPLFISGIEFANTNKCKHWVGVGSQAEYGNLNKKIDENQKCLPTTLYGKSKLYLSQITKDICEIYSINHTWLRLFSVYGPDDNHEWFIQYLIKRMISSEDINVTKCEQFWDYLYIDDISRALFKISPYRGLGVTNLSSNNPIQIKDLVEILLLKTNSDSKVNYGAVPYRDDQVMFMCGDNTKLKKSLNWEPLISHEEGLNKTILNIKK